MADLELEIDDDTHTYRLDGAIIPGCTGVLAAVGATPGFWFLTPEEREYYRDRGKAGHKAVELAIKKTLDRRLPQWIKNCLIGWDRFRNDYHVEVINIETCGEARLRSGPFVELPLHHPVYRYGVTPDVGAVVKGSEGPIELKFTSAHSAATEIQTAAQQLAMEHALGVKLDGPRWAVRLFPDEPYFEPKKYTERGDRATWISMLNTYNWRRRKGLIKES